MATWKNKRDSKLNWETVNPILGPGVIGVELDTGRFKMGNGAKQWRDLPYFLPDDEILDLIEQTLSDLPSGGTTDVGLGIHIMAEEPHPAYDDLPSFSSYYQNRKATV